MVPCIRKGCRGAEKPLVRSVGIFLAEKEKRLNDFGQFRRIGTERAELFAHWGVAGKLKPFSHRGHREHRDIKPENGIRFNAYT
jgi:hypothetical protein